MNLRCRIERLERQSGVSRRPSGDESDYEFLARVKAATPPHYYELSDADLERFIRRGHPELGPELSDADLDRIARERIERTNERGARGCDERPKACLRPLGR